ncbi:GxGYxYP domain-containing protein [Aeoliella mucimassa]|uniref:Uncharacterized protein n=1 Tax=Aeoliella mucimassa TaxID=2527972 RepID=A0A518ALF6_9BACT|nr:GxGYxYP domain-containing protein [Aeoliella mucimassa]QDU55563.1 hypothetical protein Pan181_17550 [Aeoliella mucimassa]
MTACRFLVLILLACVITLPEIAAAEAPESWHWPDGQVLPHLPAPADSLDAMPIQSLTRDEQLAFVALQGHVNKTRPRIWLINRRSEEGADTWQKTLGLQIGTTYDYHNKYDLIAKYAGEIKGVVLYDPSANEHLCNLAATVAGLRGALPVTPTIREHLLAQQIDLPVLEDLTSLELPTATDVYEHLYANYWSECEKRFLISARPGRGGDYHHTRDMATACGAAMVWLDCREPAERELFGKFLADMPAGNAVVLGWYTTERSGVTTATHYGIGTMPADHFMNSTVFSGGDHTIHHPEVPPTPELQNKLYVAMLLSDGDNIQYTQHALRRIWDRSADARGDMPISWTISPGLVDIAPSIMNYYYQSATPNDCFISGPSGMGYTMPVNTLEEPGAALGSTIDDPQRWAAYTGLTSRYLQRAGLRVVTIWDNLTPMQRQVYEQQCPTLLGVTVQNFKDDPTVASSLEGDRLCFERLQIPYAGSRDQLRRSLERQLATGIDTQPRFAAYQADIWSELQPERLLEIMREIEEEHPEIEFVRADHYFRLRNQDLKQNY